MAAMAMEDGYVPEMPSDQIEAHLADCGACRKEVGQLRGLANLIAAQERRQRSEESVWPRVERRLPDAAFSKRASNTWRPFLFLGALLLGYRIAEMVSGRDFGVLFKVGPILLVIAAFCYLRENPFKIESELSLEGE
jgi:predicted anti-sigma-YlaC factor YlaD